MVTSRAIEAIDIKTTVTIPRIFDFSDIVLLPMIFLLFPIISIKIIKGGARIAFRAAEYTNIVIGFIGEKLMRIPRSVAMVIAP